MDEAGYLAVVDRKNALERLAGFKQPKYIVIADALPKNPSGKILKRELREKYAHLAEQEPKTSGHSLKSTVTSNGRRTCTRQHSHLSGQHEADP
jgi:hypothetical protein